MKKLFCVLFCLWCCFASAETCRSQLDNGAKFRLASFSYDNPTNSPEVEGTVECSYDGSDSYKVQNVLPYPTGGNWSGNCDFNDCPPPGIIFITCRGNNVDSCQFTTGVAS